MKHKDPKVTDELLLKAKAEFLQYGYMNASLRRIASESGVSTNSIYGRFRDKLGLFDALVKNAADELYDMVSDMCRQASEETDIDENMEAENVGTGQFVDYIYDHLDIFQLIFCKSAGTGYEDYLDRLSKMEEEVYKVQIQRLGMSEEVDGFFIHAITVSGYRYLYEMIAHGLDRQEAHRFMEKMTEFRMAGWRCILG